MRELTPLCQLAIKYSCDKGGRHNTYNHDPCHGTHEYTPIYWDLFHFQRMHVKSVLEIGVNKGCSLRMWKEFFPNARILGLDIEPACLFSEDRIRTALADQRDPLALLPALGCDFPFDVIIDDGSHQLHDQVIALNALASFLSPIGIYVIEDIPYDPQWWERLRINTPQFLDAGIVEPPLGTGTMQPEALYVATRE